MRGNIKKAMKKMLASCLMICMLATTLAGVNMELLARDVLAETVYLENQEGIYQLDIDSIDKKEVARTTSNAIQITTPSAVQLMGRVYYVSNFGDDNNDGLSPETAWATVEKVNEQILQPGDKVLFKAGDVWNPINEGYAPEINGGWPQWESEEGIATAFLKPQGNGTEQAPIIIGKYGSDEYSDRPIFNGLGKVNFTVHIKNMNHVVVEDIEVTNYDPREIENQDHKRVLRGIYVENHGIEGNTMKDITIQDCFVKDINARYHHRFNNEGGIIVRSTKAGPYNFDGVYIRNNTIQNVDYGGIFFRNDNQNRGAIAAGIGPWIGSPNVVIENNSIDTIGGDGIVVSTGIGTIIQYNVVKDSHLKCPAPCAAIWNINSDDTLLQYNEAYLTRQDSDGQAYDADGGCDRTVYQYNYSHDNEGGFMLLCQWGGGDNRNGVIRYNISQNDMSKIIHFAGAENFKIYNNTFYAGPGNNTKMTYGEGNSAEFNNNIFYNEGTNFTFARGSRHIYNNNLYYGIDESKLPNDVNKIIEDPMLYAPGTGGALYPLSIESDEENRAQTWNELVNEKLKGYKLLEGSPAINSGVTVDLTSNGVTPATRDFFGNPIIDGKLDIGAHEFTYDEPEEINKGTTWTFSEGYSMVSGENNWSYLLFSEEYTPLAIIFDMADSHVDGIEPAWRGTQWILKKDGGANPMEGSYPNAVVPVDESVAYIARDKMSLPVTGYRPHTMYNNGPTNMDPLAQHDRIGYGFLVPQSGVYNISGVAKKVTIGGDGVDVSIRVNGNKVIMPSSTIEADNNRTGIAHDITVDLNKGDVVYFVADSKENNEADIISWDPTVTYLENQIDKPEIPKGSYFVDDSVVTKIKYTEMIPQTHLTEALGMNKTTHVSAEDGQGEAEFSFIGSGIRIISQKSHLNGEMEILLYKGEEEIDRVIVSAYQEQIEPFFEAYNNQDLKYGEYKVVVRNKGPQMIMDGFIINTNNEDGTSNIHTINVSSNSEHIRLTLEDEEGNKLQEPYQVLRGSKITVKSDITSNAHTLVGYSVNGTIQDPIDFTLTIQEDTRIEAVVAGKNSGILLDLSQATVSTNNRHHDPKYGPEKAFDKIEDDVHAYAPSYENTFPLNGKPAPYLIVELPQGTAVTQTTLINKGMGGFRVKSYKVEFSTDGELFTDEKIYSNMAQLQESTITLAQPIPATHLKITVLEDDDNRNNFVLSEFKVYATSSVDKTKLTQAILDAEQLDLTNVPEVIADEFKVLIEMAKMYERAIDISQQEIDTLTVELTKKQELIESLIAGHEVYISVECEVLGGSYSIAPQVVTLPNEEQLKATGSTSLKGVLIDTFAQTTFNADGKLISLNHMRPTSWIILKNNDRINVQPDTRNTIINAKDTVRIIYSNEVDGKDILKDRTNKDALVRQIALINTYQKDILESDQVLKQAYTNAVEALKDTNLRQEEVDKVASTLEKVSKPATNEQIQSLKNKLTEVKAIDKALYTTTSYENLMSIVQEVSKILEQEKINELDIEEAINGLNEGVMGLVLIEDSEATVEEIQVLKDKIEEARGFEKKLYTSDSYEKLEIALKQANKVLEQEKITKGNIKEALSNLSKAISELKRVSTGGGGSSSSDSENSDQSLVDSKNVVIDGIEIDPKDIIAFKDEEMISEYAKNAVDIASALGFINGSEGYLKPKDSITRAEFIKIIAEVLKLDTSKGYKGEFEDVTSEEWYANYLAAAYHKGILKGDGGKANPNELLTRQDMATLLVRALELEEKEYDKKINDFTEISDYAKSAVQTAYSYHLIEGMDGNFKPHEYANREMAITIMVRMYKSFVYEK